MHSLLCRDNDTSLLNSMMDDLMKSPDGHAPAVVQMWNDLRVTFVGKCRQLQSDATVESLISLRNGFFCLKVPSSLSRVPSLWAIIHYGAL